MKYTVKHVPISQEDTDEELTELEPMLKKVRRGLKRSYALMTLQHLQLGVSMGRRLWKKNTNWSQNRRVTFLGLTMFLITMMMIQLQRRRSQRQQR
jgi:hypothetical protein